MKELTDVQYEAVGFAVLRAWQLGMPTHSSDSDRASKVGRAAYAACFPYAVAEALAKPSSDECSLFGKRYASPSGCKGALLGFLSERACDLTAKPDPAVEAVAAICKEYDAHTRYEGHQEFIAKIVAAVDAARAK